MGHDPGPVEDAFTSAAWGGVVIGGLLAGLAWEVVALAAASSPPALSESSESHVRSCRATRDRVGPNAASRPRRGGPPAVVSESHPSGESGDTGRRRPGARCPARSRSARPAGTSITNPYQGPKRSHLDAGVGTHAVRASRVWRDAVAKRRGAGAKTGHREAVRCRGGAPNACAGDPLRY